MVNFDENFIEVREEDREVSGRSAAAKPAFDVSSKLCSQLHTQLHSQLRSLGHSEHFPQGRDG